MKRPRIIKYIVDLWRHYRFLRFAKKELKRDSFQEYRDIQNAYRAKRKLEQKELSELWNELLDDEYVMVIGSQSHLRITAKGKRLIGGGLYGYINALLKEKGAPLLVLSGIVTLADFGYHVAKHFNR